MQQKHEFDVMVVGTGPAGQKAAIASAKLGRRVAIADRRTSMGGACIHSGTIPSKTLREAVLYLSGHRQKSVYGRSYTVKEGLTMSDLLFRVDKVIAHESEVVSLQLRRNGITLIPGQAAFLDPHTMVVHSDADSRLVTADHFVLAPGTMPARPASVPFDGDTVVDSDEVLKLKRIPRQMIVVGGGVIGLEYANMFAALGVEITLVDGKKDLLEFVDREIMEALQYRMRSMGVTFRLGDAVVSVARDERGRIIARLDSGKRFIGEMMLFCVGRQGHTHELNLPAVGLETDARGRIPHDEFFRTPVQHVYAVGDVIGFPALASTSMEQGRIAAQHIAGLQPKPISRDLPYGIYTIPEISMIGRTEEELTKERVPYEVGQARYNEIAKGQIVGDDEGMLKILFHQETRRILGVHSIGESSAEIIHVGQAVMELGGTIDYFRDAVFNYPTMAECYKVAAYDGLNKLG
jgi:NAD(P) transhydrogenase